MTKTGFFMIVVMEAIFCSISFGATYGGGTGTAQDPYLIQTAEQMNAIGANSDDWTKSFKLMADIDMSDYTGTEYNIIGNSTTKFSGTFDGNGYTISNLTYETDVAVENVGLFGYIMNATIQNLDLQDVDLSSGGSFAGALVGYQFSGTISDCSSTGSVILSSSSSTPIAGGLVGNQNSGTIIDCFSTGVVISSSAAFSSLAGGLVGRQQAGSITSCYSLCTVTSSIYSSGFSSYSGGLVGHQNAGTITNCYSTGSVTSSGPASSTSYVGGLVGYQANNSNARIEKSYSAGPVYSTEGTVNDGGLLGYKLGGSGTVTGCFWDKVTSGLTDSAGGSGVQGKTTAEMKTLSNFTASDWDFTTSDGDAADWWMPVNSYPRQAWENPYGGGNGTADEPYQIWTAQQMNTIGTDPNDWNDHFKLMADIDMSDFNEIEYNIIGNSTVQFTGAFDGNGYTISNLTYTTDSDIEYVGLFGYIYNATIQDLGIQNVNLSTACSFVGGLAGNQQSSTITGCFTTGSVSSSSADSNTYAGGLVGRQYSGTISNCYSTASVAAACADAGDTAYAGGLAGYQNSGAIMYCYSTGAVSTSGSGTKMEGGLTAFSSGVIASFWDIQTSGQITSDGGTGKTTAQMKTLSTFTSAGWDFVGEIVNGINDYWQMPPGDYPKFAWQDISENPLFGSEFPDFNNDSNKDIIWRQSAAGSYLIQLMDGVNTISRQTVGGDLTLEIAGLSDFDGDDTTDLLWEKTSTGANYITLINEGVRGLFQYVPDSKGTTLEIVDLADFDGDGTGDLLWENTSTSANFITLINDGVRGVFQYIADSSGGTLEIVGLSDFDGDGTVDLLWENTSTSANFITLINEGVRSPFQYIADSKGGTLEIVDLADFDGDGTIDLLWENILTSANFITLVDGGVRDAFQYIPDSAGGTLEIVDMGDFDGNGTTDLLWENTSTSANYITLMTGAVRGQFKYIANSKGGALEITGLSDFDGDTTTDLLWENTSTGANYITLVNNGIRGPFQYIPDSTGSSLEMIVPLIVSDVQHNYLGID